MAHNGSCDDGGPGSDTAICAFGTDCADCEPRSKLETDQVPDWNHWIDYGSYFRCSIPDR